ncbi:hypothetical protein JQX13_05735 [Archangium violaceum]|uniref:hypothetical protein n=1 Tax=Archangium violaceum TaxID=83451 RepID=UPI00193B7E23|nr:hypothetical protein [Archangium violaceum]QRK09633.1 hypothetical protein JQX13_05735 [Archangium violaceum]
MRPLHLLHQMFLSSLSALVLLTASSARADLPHERFFLSREEISEEALRGVIGIAIIHTMTGPDYQPTASLPRFAPRGDDFVTETALPLKQLRAISGWDWDYFAFRKFPVIEKRGEYLHIVIDAHTNERAWVSLNTQAPQETGVQFVPLDSPEWEWNGIELYLLASQGQTRLYNAPRPEAISHPLSPLKPPRRNGALIGDLRIMKTRGKFMQIGELLSLDEPLAPVGWVPITDEQGRLLVWPVLAPMC